MACSSCHSARTAAAAAIKAAARGNLKQAASAARQAAHEIKSKVAESDRIRAITRKR